MWAMSENLVLLPAVDVADGQAVRLVQGEAGSETSYGDPLTAAMAWQDAGARVDPPGGPRRGVRPGLNRALLAEVMARWTSRSSCPAASATTTRSTRRWRPARAGSTSAPPRSRTRSGATGSSSSTATGSRSGSTSAAGPWRPAAGPRKAATCTRCSSGWKTAGCERYVVTDVTKDGMLQGPNLDLYRDLCAAHRRADRRLRRRLQPGRPQGAEHTGPGRRRRRHRR